MPFGLMLVEGFRLHRHVPDHIVMLLHKLWCLLFKSRPILKEHPDSEDAICYEKCHWLTQGISVVWSIIPANMILFG